jgi:hypothetical protein
VSLHGLSLSICVKRYCSKCSPISYPGAVSDESGGTVGDDVFLVVTLGSKVGGRGKWDKTKG